MPLARMVRLRIPLVTVMPSGPEAYSSSTMSEAPGYPIAMTSCPTSMVEGEAKTTGVRGGPSSRTRRMARSFWRDRATSSLGRSSPRSSSTPIFQPLSDPSTTCQLVTKIRPSPTAKPDPVSPSSGFFRQTTRTTDPFIRAMGAFAQAGEAAESPPRSSAGRRIEAHRRRRTRRSPPGASGRGGIGRLRVSPVKLLPFRGRDVAPLPKSSGPGRKGDDRRFTPRGRKRRPRDPGPGPPPGRRSIRVSS